MGTIKQIWHLTPLNILTKVYNSLVQPHFDYCKCGASYDSNLDDLFQALGWQRQLSKIATEVYPNV